MSIYNIQVSRSIRIQYISIEGGDVLSQTPNKITIVRENTQTLLVTGVFDDDEQAFWTGSSTLNGQLIDEFGNTIFDIALPYVLGSAGIFSGEFGDANFLPPIGRGYTLIVKGVNTSGRALKIPVLAEVISAPVYGGAITAGSVPPAPSPIKEIYQGNTQDITVNGLQDEVTGVFLNGATLTATLYDPQDVAVPGCIGISLPYIPASSGNYQGFFGDNTFQPPLGLGYTLVISGFEGSTSIQITYESEVVVRTQ